MAEAALEQINMDRKKLTERERHWLGHFKRYQGSGLSLAAYARSQGGCAQHLLRVGTQS